VDAGSSTANGIGFAVSAAVAAPLLEAWMAAPQPVAPAACVHPAPATTAVGYVGRFTSVDRLERCNGTRTYVYCSAGPSGKAVKLVAGDRVYDLGLRGSGDLGGSAMPEGTSLVTGDGRIECTSSSRGIGCSDRTTGASFVLGDYALMTSAGSATRAGSSTYSGYFASVDRLQHCYLAATYARCGSGPSGQVVQLVVALGGSGAEFTIGDHYARVNGRRIAA
jgi:hypothetical protein